MKQYKLVNNLVGWFIFLIAAIVYCMTIEPTASFWDCPEFISTGYKLEIGHPPGAPFFMLTSNLFTQFVSDPALVARMVNTMSALLSATCILFLFWTITHLTRKLIITDESDYKKPSKIILIMGAGAVGALAYTFSDTFWFSAVEGEVYAFSSMFTAVVFWLILKWEDVADEPHSDRWLVLIAYLTGLSIGVHLLNLLCIPAIVLVYYYKKNPKANLKGSLIALLGSMILIAVVLYGIVPGIVKVGGWFELFFVNTLGFGFNTGFVIYIFLLVASIIWGVYETFVEKSDKRMSWSFIITIGLLGIPFYGHGVSCAIIGIVALSIIAFYLNSKTISKKHKASPRVLNTTLLCMMMIVIGYSSYALIVIRSVANPPLDEDSPEDVFSLGEYLGREQYGTRPLFWGPAFSSKPALEAVDGGYRYKIDKGTPSYVRKDKKDPNEKDQYVAKDGMSDYVYAQNMLFPRMYDAAHAEDYKRWVNITGHDVAYDAGGQTQMVNMPNQWENIKFFFTYQLNFMYWRYFMWNFAGRQNDLQGSGEVEHGNWITGFNSIDKYLVGDRTHLPDELAQNKGYNVFYCLPLLLGVLGIFFQAYRGEKGIQGFWEVFFLFFMTGIAIVIYLNQAPGQPRERDYAYAGSFYAFAIWIGMGVAMVYKFLHERIKMKELPASILASLVCLLVPIQMVSQTWDDHDRSGRYTCRDFGQNYLNSCQEKGNPIIYTNGDNDTFPLWYNQETEGVRTDVRVCNLSYLQTNWYIDQMKRPSYSSPAIPINWTSIQYANGTNEYLQVQPNLKTQILELMKNNPKEAKQMLGDNPFELKNIIHKWVLSDNPEMHCIPTDSIIVPIDKNAVLASGMMIPDSLHGKIPDQMVISLKGKTGLSKSELMMLEMLSNTDWKRPIYMAITVGPENHLCFDNYFTLEGMAYRITPFQSAKGPRIDSEKMYNNIMTKFKWGGLDNPKVYIDENIMSMCKSHRRLFSQLATQLIQEGKKEKALKLLNYGEKVIPEKTVPHDYSCYSQNIAQCYYQLGQKAKAEHIVTELFDKSAQYLNWYNDFSDAQIQASAQSCALQLYELDEMCKILESNKSPKAKMCRAKFYTYYNKLNARIGGVLQGAR